MFHEEWKVTAINHMLLFEKDRIFVSALILNPGFKSCITTTVVAEMDGNPGFNTATTTTVAPKIAAIVKPTAAADRRSSVADCRCSAATDCLLTRGNLPLRNVGHVLN